MGQSPRTPEPRSVSLCSCSCFYNFSSVYRTKTGPSLQVSTQGGEESGPQDCSQEGRCREGGPTETKGKANLCGRSEPGSRGCGRDSLAPLMLFRTSLEAQACTCRTTLRKCSQVATQTQPEAARAGRQCKISDVLSHGCAAAGTEQLMLGLKSGH